MVRDLRARLYGPLLAFCLDYCGQKSSSGIASRMSNDVNVLQQDLSMGLTRLVQHVLTLALVIVLLFRLDAVLTTDGLLAVPLVIVASVRMGEGVTANPRTTLEKQGQLMAALSESISGIDVIKAFDLEGHALGRCR